MGTLADIFKSVRLRIKDQKSTEFEDTDLLTLVLSTLGQVQQELKQLESNLLIKSGSIQCVADQSTYTFAEADSFVNGSVWIDDPAMPLTLSMRSDVPADPNRPESYALLPSGEVQFSPTPNADYLVKVLYFERPTWPGEDDIATYDVPWLGIWNRAIEYSLTLECLSILERYIGTVAVQAGDAWDEATVDTYAQGHIVRSNRGRMFDGL